MLLAALRAPGGERKKGAPAQSVRHGRQAEDSLSTWGDDPEWLDFFDPAPPEPAPRSRPARRPCSTPVRLWTLYKALSTGC